MSRNVRAMSCSPQAVFDVLADGWLYPGWVVGASRMRDIRSRMAGREAACFITPSACGHC